MQSAQCCPSLRLPASEVSPRHLQYVSKTILPPGGVLHLMQESERACQFARDHVARSGPTLITRHSAVYLLHPALHTSLSFVNAVT